MTDTPPFLEQIQRDLTTWQLGGQKRLKRHIRQAGSQEIEALLQACSSLDSQEQERVLETIGEHGTHFSRPALQKLFELAPEVMPGRLLGRGVLDRSERDWLAYHAARTLQGEGEIIPKTVTAEKILKLSTDQGYALPETAREILFKIVLDEPKSWIFRLLVGDPDTPAEMLEQALKVGAVQQSWKGKIWGELAVHPQASPTVLQRALENIIEGKTRREPPILVLLEMFKRGEFTSYDDLAGTVLEAHDFNLPEAAHQTLLEQADPRLLAFYIHGTQGRHRQQALKTFLAWKPALALTLLEHYREEEAGEWVDPDTLQVALQNAEPEIRERGLRLLASLKPSESPNTPTRS